MIINIVAVGKIKDSYLAEGVSEFKKRLGRFAEVNILECAESACDSVQKTLETEAAAVLPKLKGCVVALAVEGKELSSEGLAELIASRSQAGASELTFVIGGAEGLAESVKRRADFLLSFGPMTFPHRLIRLMLAEQIYRAFTIIEGHPYHRGDAPRKRA
ncbi:MAG TPA: 23S rRNA (pseudouridine(1915)-N(3))-methyltransferase RlmH [Eubacteriales bacterium]|jgi:23S rRNA (pseudouridine1915-N3)-methyltransferase|nr:23S rRNA (pseudouridine(1915)-N(3))-methyltransferase RlmH [Clostridia bacterium]HRR89702.1 23S rRNA (pseudouridine(1915)-N(3))-methyltransferase RlmH [Eubacteriales bacterium]HRU84579.1 23S rRNA (pseudouridine(1915)-N(3))-methyltransferase RlmH [Eubacteriales bacterium]